MIITHPSGVKKKKRRIFKYLFLSILLMGMLLLSADILIRLPVVHDYILKEISANSGYEIKAGRFYTGLRRGPALHGFNLEITMPGGGLALIPEVYIHLNKRGLIRGAFLLKSVTFIRPSITLDSVESHPLSPALFRHFFDFLKRFYPRALSEVTIEDAFLQRREGKPLAASINARLMRSEKGILSISAKGTVLSEKGTRSFQRIEAVLRDALEEGATPSIEADLDMIGIPEDLLEKAGITLLREEAFSLSLHARCPDMTGVFLTGSLKARRLAFSLDGGEKTADLPKLRADFSAMITVE